MNGRLDPFGRGHRAHSLQRILAVGSSGRCVHLGDWRCLGMVAQWVDGSEAGLSRRLWVGGHSRNLRWSRARNSRASGSAPGSLHGRWNAAQLSSPRRLVGHHRHLLALYRLLGFLCRLPYAHRRHRIGHGCGVLLRPYRLWHTHYPRSRYRQLPLLSRWRNVHGVLGYGWRSLLDFFGRHRGIITASAGNDLYHPVQAMFLGAFGVYCANKLHVWVERRFQIDDAVGAVAVHGYCGVIGIVACGFMLWGYPSSPTEGYPVISPWGQIAGAFIMFALLGFAPCYGVAGLLKKLGVLRIPLEVELAGLDHDVLVEEARQADEILRAEREDMAQRLLQRPIQRTRDGVKS